MRVLHVITDLDNGGAEAALMRLVAADVGDQHTIVSLMDDGMYGDRLRRVHARVETVGMRRGRLSVQGFMRMRSLIREIRPDIVQTWMYHADLVGGLAAALAGTRAIVWGVRASDAHEHTAGRGLSRLVKTCAFVSDVLPSRIVVNSTAGAATHRELGYPAAKLRVVPNGFDLSSLAPDGDTRRAQRETWGIGMATALVGMVARWDPLKDHETLLAAMRDLLDRVGLGRWAVVLVGTGMSDANEQLAMLIAKHGLADHVRLVGPVADVRPVMNALDIHILSSRSEAFPNVLAEAMACGTPCVTTAVGDASYIVDSTGWIVPPRDAGALADAVEAALRARGDPSAWSTRQMACRERITKEFTVGRMVEGYRRVWQETLQ